MFSFPGAASLPFRRSSSTRCRRTKPSFWRAPTRSLKRTSPTHPLSDLPSGIFLDRWTLDSKISRVKIKNWFFFCNISFIFSGGLFWSNIWFWYDFWRVRGSHLCHWRSGTPNEFVFTILKTLIVTITMYIAEVNMWPDVTVHFMLIIFLIPKWINVETVSSVYIFLIQP